jgi:hypothetical protein
MPDRPSVIRPGPIAAAGLIAARLWVPVRGEDLPMAVT